MFALDHSRSETQLHASSDVVSSHTEADGQDKPISFQIIYPLSPPAPFKLLSYDSVKRLMDLLAGPILVIAFAPLMCMIAIFVRLTSSGPAIYKQQRLTTGGRVFTMYKFRTMYQDAESKTGPIWAACEDPRITAVGKFLRVTRLDELPQLINVLKGDMSLIGPRPERPEMAAQLLKEFPTFARRLEVRAGITGLAQIASGYASTVHSYRRKLKLDIKYIENRCLMLDLRIAIKTIQVVLTGTGAR